MTCKHRLTENFKSIDMFGQSISFTWNGEEEYKTPYGAFVSAVIILTLLAYTGYKIDEVIQRKSPTVSKTTSLVSEIDAAKPFSPQELGFDFAFGLNNPLDPSLGYVSVSYINWTQTGNGTHSKISKNIDLVTCGDTNFNYTNKE